MNIREMHDFLNYLWEGTFMLNGELRGVLKERGFTVEPVEEAFNGYIYIDGEWRLMKYPYPVFEVKPHGEIGATLQGFYFVFAVPREKLTPEFVREFTESFEKAFIYGAEDFLHDFYNPDTGGGAEEILERINSSSEEIIQFEVEMKTPEDLKDALFRFIEIGAKYGILED